MTTVDALVLLTLAILPLGLTTAMFYTRNMMLGFPSAIFWAILGVYAYTQSTIPWGDWQFFLFFACAFGMTIFCMLAMYGLREVKDTEAEGEVEEGAEWDKDFYGERKSSEEETASSRPGERTKRLRHRASLRRTGEVNKTKIPYFTVPKGKL